MRSHFALVPQRSDEAQAPVNSVVLTPFRLVNAHVYRCVQTRIGIPNCTETCHDCGISNEHAKTAEVVIAVELGWFKRVEVQLMDRLHSQLIPSDCFVQV